MKVRRACASEGKVRQGEQANSRLKGRHRSTVKDPLGGSTDKERRGCEAWLDQRPPPNKHQGTESLTIPMVRVR